MCSSTPRYISNRNAHVYAQKDAKNIIFRAALFIVTLRRKPSNDKRNTEWIFFNGDIFIQSSTEQKGKGISYNYVH